MNRTIIARSILRGSLLRRVSLAPAASFQFKPAIAALHQTHLRLAQRPAQPAPPGHPPQAAPIRFTTSHPNSLENTLAPWENVDSNPQATVADLVQELRLIHSRMAYFIEVLADLGEEDLLRNTRATGPDLDGRMFRAVTTFAWLCEQNMLRTERLVQLRNQAAPNQATANQAAPNQATANQAAPNQATANQAAPNQAAPNRAAPNQPRR